MENSLHLALAKKFWKELLRPGDTVIDATCGGGQDTLFLASLPVGKLYALDIQEAALKKARGRLPLEMRAKVTFLLKSHEDLPRVSPRLVVYNLGYLPGGDKTKTTRAETTLQSLKSAFEVVPPGGAISIMCYPGHPEGALEEEVILKFLIDLSSSVECYRYTDSPQRKFEKSALNPSPTKGPVLLWICL